MLILGIQFPSPGYDAALYCAMLCKALWNTDLFCMFLIQKFEISLSPKSEPKGHASDKPEDQPSVRPKLEKTKAATEVKSKHTEKETKEKKTEENTSKFGITFIITFSSYIYPLILMVANSSLEIWWNLFSESTAGKICKGKLYA